MPASSVAFFIPRPASLPQLALEELAVLVEMVDGIVVVGARALHELVKVVRRVMLGLSARIICRGGQRGVGWLAEILSILFSPLRGGALILILASGLTFVVAPIAGGVGQRSMVLGYQGWDSDRHYVRLGSAQAVHR